MCDATVSGEYRVNNNTVRHNNYNIFFNAILLCTCRVYQSISFETKCVAIIDARVWAKCTICVIMCISWICDNAHILNQRLQFNR